MDPNNNINPTVPMAGAMPEGLAQPSAPTTSSMPVIPTAPAPAAPVVPVASAMPEMPTAPAPAAPVVPTVSAMPEMPAPVAPVVNPTNSNPEPVAPVAPETPEAAPTATTFQATDNPMLGATDPIMMPNPPKAPDPVEEELKAPMKAADPVPGSIGSAISMPSEQPVAPEAAVAGQPQMGQVPSVAFNDPAAAQGQTMQQNAPAAAAKSKNPFKNLDKKSLIMLCAIAGIVVVALIIVLVSMMN